MGLANKKKSEAGFIGLLAFLVFINAMNRFMGLTGILVEGNLSGTGQTTVLGVQVLDMGVFLGLMLGIIVAWIHNRFCETEFNNAFQIYGGTRFVFIVLIPLMVVLAVVLTLCVALRPGGHQLSGQLHPGFRQLGPVRLRYAGAPAHPHRPASSGLHPLSCTPPLGGVAEVGGQIYEGARNIYYAEIADPSVAVLSQSVIWDARGISKMFA